MALSGVWTGLPADGADNGWVKWPKNPLLSLGRPNDFDISSLPIPHANALLACPYHQW
jgi:hypothetical protein